MNFKGLSIDEGALSRLCERFGVRRLALFGSMLHGSAGPLSDVDVLIEYHVGARTGLRFFTLQHELSQLLGRAVDLNTAACLHPSFRARVLAEARDVYVAA